jgi:hypothetical protein
VKRSGIKPRRSAPRRREAPRWTRDDWEYAGVLISVRSGGCCEKCGTDRGPFERHHRKRRRDGGDRLAKILYLCGGPQGCHGWITEHPAEARKAGWIVSVSRDPADVPVLTSAHEWVFLDDDGTVRPAFDVGDAHE